MREIPLQTLLDTSKLEQDALVELYDLDLTGLGGSLLRFHSGVNEFHSGLIWKGHLYQPYPVEASGFELSGQGTSNRPKFVASNLLGMLTGLNESFDDLVGGVVTRRQVYATYLDSDNFRQGNPKADPTQEIVSRYIIERLVSQDAESVTYEMALPSELDNAVIPARMISTDVCSWCYRSAECGYDGAAVANELDEPTGDLTKDKCGKRLSSCKLRFGANAILPIGCFPTASRLS